MKRTTQHLLLAAVSALITSNAAYAADVEKGKAMYATLCVTCHGPTGLGDGPVAASLPPEVKPANLQTGPFKYATDDVKLAEVIKKGGAAVGLSPLMTGAPSASDEDIANIIAFIHSIQKK